MVCRIALFVCLFVCSETFEIYAVLYFFGKIYIVDRQNHRERSILHLLVCSPDALCDQLVQVEVRKAWNSIRVSHMCGQDLST